MDGEEKLVFGGVVAGITAVALFLISIVAGTTYANVHGDYGQTERLTACVESGGSYVHYTGDCILEGMEEVRLD